MKGEKSTMVLKEMARVQVPDTDHIPFGMDCIRHSPLMETLKNKAGLSVLDIGCRIPYFLWVSYHIYQPQKMIGIDISNERFAINEWKSALRGSKGYEEIKGFKTFHDFYLNGIRPDPDEPQLIKDKMVFDQSFDIHFETALEDFLPTCQQKFDLINAGHVLHFLQENSELEEAIHHFRRILKPDGHVLIRVQNTHGREYFDYAFFVRILQKYFPEGVLTESFKDGKWHTAFFRNFHGEIKIEPVEALIEQC